MINSKKIKPNESWEIWNATATHTGTGHTVTFVNVAPRFGTKHIGSPDCWCEPEIRENELFLLHSPDH